MPPERRRLIVLLSILLVVGGIAVWRYSQASGGVGGGAGQSSASATRRGAGTTRVSAPEVHLRALDEDKPMPENAGGRDLFRFRPKASPPPPVAVARPPANTAPDVPPASIPGIALRFIGLVEAQAKRIAILSDGRGIYQGREGDIIEGRYRILRIGVESIDMALVDGTGRQTIRLSGS
jgi:hypothetical protein